MAERSKETMEEEEMARQSQEPEPRSTAVVENIQPLPETRDLKRTAENTQMLQAGTPASERVCVPDVQQSLSQHYTEGSADTPASKRVCLTNVQHVSLSQHHTEGSANLSIGNPSHCTINVIQLKQGTTEDILPVLEKLTASSKPQPTLDSAVKPADGDGSRQGAHPTKDPGQVAAERCREALRSHYTTTGSYVKLIPWEDDDTKHIEDIYTKLTLEKSGEKLKSYKEIFHQTTRRGYPINRVVLNGLPGRGKSTLMDKMAYDWACNEALQQFELVFVLRMSAVEQSTELIDSIFAQLLAEDTDVDEGALRSFISHNEEKVLILLDGFDELKTPALDKTVFGSILKILNRKKGRDCYVVVTTRPSHYNKLVSSSLVQEPFTQVRVQGFEEEDIKEYIERFYFKEHGKAKGLLQRISSSNVLSDLAKSPMLLLLMCILWRDNSTLPETMSRIYSEALVYIFQRKTDMSPDEISKVTNELGKIGLHGLLAPKQMLAFPEEMFEPSVLESAIKAGILTRQKVLKGMKSHNSIQFLHKTFQEYCAGKYLQSLLETDPVEFKRTLNEMIKTEFDDFEYLFRFCSGDNMACTSIILQTLVESYQFKENPESYESLINCYFECQSKDLPPVEFIESVLSERVVIYRWNRDILNSFTYLLHTLKNKQTDYLARVHSVEIAGCVFGGCMSDLTYCMSLMVNLSSVTLSECPLAVNSKEDAAQSGATSYQVGSAASWAHHFKKIKNLRRLFLLDCSLIGDDMAYFAPALFDLTNLVELSLIKIEAFGGSAASWAHHLKEMKNLRKLCFTSCSLIGEDMTHFAPALCDLPNLVELNLGGNEALGGSAASWAHHFMKMKNLQKLRFVFCSLTGEDMTHFAPALCDLPILVELNLEGNQALGGSAASWAHHLKKMKNLRKLWFRSCSLIGEDMTHIAPALCDLPNLVVLSLRGNEALGCSAASWAHHFKKMKNLQTLEFVECSLIGEDMTHIAPALCDLPNLVELGLEGNQALDGSVASWAHHFEKMENLEIWGGASSDPVLLAAGTANN